MTNDKWKILIIYKAKAPSTKHPIRASIHPLYRSYSGPGGHHSLLRFAFCPRGLPALTRLLLANLILVLPVSLYSLNKLIRSIGKSRIR